MPVVLKSQSQIELLRQAGALVAETFAVLAPHVRPGVTTLELDAIAEEFIRSHGAIPVYKGYGGARATRSTPGRKPFPGSICASINDVICHGIPSKQGRLRQGDIIGVDIGVKLNGWVGDACYTYAVGDVDERVAKLLTVTQECLQRGIEAARPGNRMGDIGAAIQQHAEAHGFSVVREYTGHGVGRNLHEEPTVLHYGTPGTGLKLQKGMVFTIEPMINLGGATTRQERDGWTVRTADGSLSAQFEHQLAILDDGAHILTAPLAIESPA